MKILSKNIIAIVILLVSFTGCEKDLLEQTNPSALTAGSFWKTESDFEKGMASVYSSLQFSAVSGQELVKGMMRTDLAGSEPWYGLWTEFSDFRWNDATEAVKNRWTHLYIGIFRANQLLDKLASTSIEGFTDEEKLLMEAQARFIRGFNYFQLAHSFNGAVIHITTPNTDEEMKKPFSTRAEVISTVVIPDLEFAYNVLPKEWPDDELGRITWGAAASMLGKTYLYDKDWSTASTYFKEVIDEANNGLYFLVENFMDNFTEEGEFNKESIFEVVFSDQFNPGVNGAKTDPILGNAGMEGTRISTDFASIQGAGGYNTCLPTYWLHELFVAGDTMDLSSTVNKKKEWSINSQRTYATIVVEEGDGMYYNAPLKNNDLTGEKTKAWFNHGQSSKVKKYTNWYRWDTEDASTGSRSGINFRHIRLADVFLMYAEAQLELNNVSVAIEYIDKVRERAGVITLQKFMDDNGGMIPELHKSAFVNGGLRTYVTADKDAVMTHLRMVERPLELCFEGHRWNDFVRWGIAKQVFTDRRAEEIKLNELLGNPVTAEPVYPLYLKELVRQDFKSPAENYNSDNHDYLPIPSIEVQSNENLGL